MIRRIATLSAVLLALGGAAALAQNPPMGGMRGGMQGGMRQGRGGFAQRRLEMLLQGITLTPQQRAQVDSITAATQQAMPPFTPGQRPDSATRAQMRAALLRQDSSVKALLTPEQQQIWDRNAANMPQRRPGMQG